MNIPSAKTYAWWLGLLRIYTGVFWLSHAIPKFTHASAFLPPGGSIGAMVSKALTVTSGPYHAFLVNTIQPHIIVFAQLVRFGELAAGVLLLLGVFTRLGGLLAVLVAINALLAGSYAPFGRWTSLEAVALALSAVSLLLPTGRVIGLDALWRRSRSRDDDVMIDTQPTPIVEKHGEVAPTPPSTVATTQGEIPVVAPRREPGPNGANGGPAFAAPASAGPHIEQTRQSV